MQGYNPDMVNNICYLSEKYLNHELYLQVDNLLKIRGDIPEVVKFILSELVSCGKNISDEDADLIRSIALEYL